MNKKILIISIILLLLIFLYILYLFSLRKKYINEAYELNKKLKTHNEQEENNKQEIKNNDYLYLTEEDFDKLDITKRWKYRSQCLNKFHEFKNDYKKINFIYPLPKSKKNGLIFVNLASYRDSECHKTIKSLIMNSKNWKNLRICVCEQNSEEDLSCLHNLNSNFHKIIKIIKMSYKNARGPTLARFLIQQQYNSEEYYLQIDSHTIFEKNWDEKLINCLKSLEPKSCLTQYLPDYQIGEFNTEPKLRGELTVSRITSLDGFTRINAPYIDPNLKYKFAFPSNGWSGCFSFSSGDICYDAPIDCYTPDVFFGEEMDICLRLFTRGWNFYAPNFPIAYTNFNRSYRETFWEKKGLGYNKNITLCSRLRFHYRLGTLPLELRELIEKDYPELLIEVDKFVLGNVRSLKDYEKLIGFNFSTESNVF